MATAGFLLAPANDPRQFGKRAANAWETKLSDVTHYRGGFDEIVSDEGTFAYLANRGARDAFNFGQFPDSDELAALSRLADSYPGHYLAVWTNGGIVTVWLADSESGLDQRAFEFSFRLHCPPANRGSAAIDRFFEALTRSPLAIDERALRDELASETISVQRFFEGLGLSGAAELQYESAASLWEEFEEVANALLRNEPVDDASLTEINGLLEGYEDEDLLPAEPCTKPAMTARIVASARQGLEELIGTPDGDLWEARLQAAGYYWDITDCDGTRSRLTYGSGESGAGIAASIGRLLGHYPQELMRDGIFLAEAAMEAEGANGHSYVEGLCALAECCCRAGFTLVVLPTSRQAEFRQHFEIGAMEGDDEAPPIDPDWCAEAFVDIDPIATFAESAKFAAWFEKQACDGVIVRCEVGGEFEIWEMGSGVPGLAADETEMRTAARSLWPRGCCAALGLPDLLEPGPWEVGSYSGMTADERERHESEMRQQAAAAISRVRAATREPEPAPDLRGPLLQQFPRWFFQADPECCGDGEILFELALPLDTPYHVAAGIMADLGGGGLLGDCGASWAAGGAKIRGYSRRRISTAMLCRCLADLPDGTVFIFETADAIPNCYLVHSSIAESAYHGAVVIADADSDDECDDNQFLAEFDAAFDEFGFDLRPLFPQRPMLEGIDLDSELVDDIILEIDDTTYFSIDLANEQLQAGDQLDKLRDEFESTGFEHLGDLVCSTFSNVIMRCFGRRDGAAYGVIMMPLAGRLSCEFYTPFNGGVSLTTTTNPSTSERLDAGAFVECCDADADVATLYRQHMERVAQLHAERRKSVVAKPNLVAQSRAIHEFLVRVCGVLL